MLAYTRILVVAALATVLAWSQNISSSVKGVVLDASSAAIPKAACTLTNQATGQRLTVSSWTDGAFTFPNVLAGKYTLSIQADGFKTLTIQNIVVTANETRTLGNLSLEIGEIKESVSVTAERAATAVQLASAERSGLVSGEQLNNIAIKGRDFFALLSTIPGVVDTYTTPRETTSTSAIAGTFINGARYNQKNYTIDGVLSMNIGANGSIPTQPNMDAVAEVKVLTSNYQAEYGRHGGGIVSVITKSGSKDFHGTAFHFYRHESLNANSFFNNRTATPKVPYRYRISGYSLGGPVFLPGRFNTDRSRLFFFFSQEYTGSRRDLGTQFVNTPTEMERRGDFSQSFDVSSRLIPVNDPLTKQPFPGNVVPASRINKLGQSILNFFPTPNFIDPDPRNLYRRNYRSTYGAENPRRNDVLRVDASLTPTLMVYYRLIQNKDQAKLPWGDWKIGNNFLLTPILSEYPGRGHTAHVTKTFSPTLVNESTFGYSLALMSSDHVDKTLVARSRMGDPPQWFPDPQLPNYVPNVAFGGQPSSPINLQIGVSPYRYADPVYIFSDNLSKVWNAHTFKAGFHLERAVIDSHDERPLWRGAFDFSRDVNNSFDSNHSFSNALLGNFRTYTETTARATKDLLLWNVEWYLQDNWRLTRRLTLDFGLRLYHMPPMSDRQQNTAHFNPSRYDARKAPALYRPGLDPAGRRMAIDPISMTLAPEALIGRYVPGSGEFANGSAVGGRDGYPTGLYTRPWLALGPRFGFAWDLFGNGKTALRAGFGLFRDTGQQNPIEGSTGNPPVTYAPTLFYGNLDTFAKGGGVVGPSAIGQAPYGRAKLPQVMQFNLGLQHQVWGTVLDASYVGSLSRNLLIRREINP
ncbi:MAG: TonB-dependent receptor, partial [Acidobacteriota bacterium]